MRMSQHALITLLRNDLLKARYVEPPSAQYQEFPQNPVMGLRELRRLRKDRAQMKRIRL